MPFAMLSTLLLILWIAGGASRADALGQVVIRTTATLLLVLMIFFGDRPDLGRRKVVWLLLLASIALPLLQLIPLPPELWAKLPHRAMFAEAAAAIGQPQPWRPWSLSPGATLNAAGSLIVPLAALTFAAGIKPAESPHAIAALLVSIVGAALIGLIQFSSGGFDNPFINETVGEVSGNFANRNHFALFLALGCILAPAWAVMGDRRPSWRAPAALGLVILFTLTILASGSRAGLLLGFFGLIAGLVLAWSGIRRKLRRLPPWVLPASIASTIGLVALIVLVSVAAGRAESIDRMFAMEPGQDMRTRALPTVLQMVRAYFPAGTGLGTFDPVFRIHEPLDLLKPTYFNHAHNDLLEIILDGGLPGFALLLSALIWWAWTSLKVWSRGSAADQMVPRLGSAILLLLIVASVFDYPARTPMMMAVAAIAAVWLSEGARARDRSTLPPSSRQL